MGYLLSTPNLFWLGYEKAVKWSAYKRIVLEGLKDVVCRIEGV